MILMEEMLMVCVFQLMLIFLDTSGIRFNTAEYSSDDNRMNIGGNSNG